MPSWLPTPNNFPIPPQLPWVPGRFYHHSMAMPGVAGVTTSAYYIQATPIYVPNLPGIRATSIGVEVTTGGAAGSLARFGIYYSTLQGRPGKLLLDAGTAPISSIGYTSVVISQYLPQGWYWLAIVASDTTANVRAHGAFAAYLTGLTGALSALDQGSYTWNYRNWVISNVFLPSCVANGLPGHWPYGGINAIDYQQAPGARIMLGV